MILVHLHSGLEKTLKEFVASMARSGWKFAAFVGTSNTGTQWLSFVKEPRS